LFSRDANTECTVIRICRFLMLPRIRAAPTESGQFDLLKTAALNAAVHEFFTLRQSAAC